MNSPVLRNLRTGLLALALAGLAAPTCQAGWFWDWLTHKNRKTCTNCPPAGYACGPYGCAPANPYYTPQVSAGYAPVTAGYAPMTGGGYSPYYATLAYSGYNPSGYTPGYAASPDAYTVGYAPQVAPGGYAVAPAGYQVAPSGYLGYGATHAPLVTYSAGAFAPPAPSAPAPASNCPTCGQQTRYVPQPVYRSTVGRVPVTYYQPLASIDPATGAPITVMRPCVGSECQLRRVQMMAPWATAGTPSCSGPGCGAVAWTQAAPAYGTTVAPLAPGASTSIVPGTPAPTVRVVPGGESNPVPFRNTFPGNEPANQQPSLDPSGLPPSGGASLEVPRWPVSSETRGFAPLPEKTPDARPEPRLMPVPDPEAFEKDAAPQAPQAPQLIDPRDQVTRSGTTTSRYPVTRVEWPQPASAPSGLSQVQRVPALSQRESDGWRPAPGAQSRP